MSKLVDSRPLINPIRQAQCDFAAMACSEPIELAPLFFQYEGDPEMLAFVRGKALFTILATSALLWWRFEVLIHTKPVP